MAVRRKGPVIEDGWQIAGKVQLLRPDGRMGPILETGWQMAVEIPLWSLLSRWQERSHY